MDSDCYWNIAHHSEAIDITNLLSVCKSSSVAVDQYIRDNQWKLTKICDFDIDDDIQTKLSCLATPPLSDNLFYGKQPLTLFHVKCLNKAIEIISANEDEGEVRNMHFPDYDMMRTVWDILKKELKKLKFQLRLTYDENYSISFEFVVKDRIVRIVDFLTDTTGDESIFDQDYIALFKHPVWLHVSNKYERIYYSDLYHSMRTGKNKVLQSSREIPLPPSIMEIGDRSPISNIPTDFSFVGLTYAEILYAVQAGGYDSSSTRLREKVESITGDKIPIEFVPALNIYQPKRTDIPPNSRDFWILIEPNPKPTDKPYITYEDPLKEKIELYVLLSILHNMDRKKQVAIIETLIKEDMLSTQIPLDLLLLTDDEILNGGLASTLLFEAKERGLTHLLPRLLFIYDFLPPSQESKKYMESLSEEVKSIIKDMIW